MSMLRNELYYGIKPLLPWGLRMRVRGLFARWKRSRHENAWPVMPGSEKPPSNWPGWPDGKRFALVLTHDVEGPDGLAKCRDVMDLERNLDLRSSFNFVPQGDYTVSPELLRELNDNGFEVGVHDLHHDGKLFRTRDEFSKKAHSINHYLRQWGAVGFRSGFMLRNLNWLHDLNIQYDASTFDTDPFEPQPDGTGTIFPFWVPRPNGTTLNPQLSTLNSQPSTRSSGYAELPYTLPQDSTLFLLFGERTPDIWFQKLDWIAKHGGMALLDVHPDYMRFNGGPASSRTFPARFYGDLLEYVRTRYGDSFWHPLPKELAAFVAEAKPAIRRKTKRVCMVTYSAYLGDTRVMRYAESLAGRGDEVHVLSLKRSTARPDRETIANVNVVRIQSRFAKDEKSALSFLLPLLRFLFASSAWIAREHTRKRFDLLHIHNIPDFLVFAAAYPKLTGAKVILDIHDIVPEFYASKFGVRENALSIKMLKWIERASAILANHVIIGNHLWIEKYAARARAKGKCSVFINNVDAEVFRPQPRARTDDKLIVIFPGGLQWHQGLDIAIRAFRNVSAKLPQAEFHIYGDGNMKEEWMALSRELGLEDKVIFFDPRPARQIAAIMANADLGVVPKRADSFGNEAYSTKIMEFMALGVPVVVSDTRIDRFYFKDSVVRFFESGNPESLSDAMIEVLGNADLRRRMVANACAYAAEHSWETRRDHYLDLVDSLIGAECGVAPQRRPRPPAPPAAPPSAPSAQPPRASAALVGVFD